MTNRAESQKASFEVLFIILMFLAAAIIFTLAYMLQDLYQRSYYSPRVLEDAWDEALAFEDGRLHVAAWKTRSASDPPLSEKYEYEHVGPKLEGNSRGESRPLLTTEEEHGYGTV